MSEQQNLELVRRGYEAFGRGDLDTLLSLLDENIEWITPGPADFPLAGRRRGLKAVGEFFQTLNQVVEVQRFEAKEFFAAGDRVIVIGDDTSRVQATDKVIDYGWVHTFTIKDGKIVSLQEYGDVSELVAELRGVQAPA